MARESVAVAQLENFAVFSFMGQNLCVSSCLCAFVVKKGAPRRHQDTKKFVQNVVQQPPPQNYS